LNWYEESTPLNKVLRGCVIDGDTFGIITAIKEDIQIPQGFYLSQNFPNPFNPHTKIQYGLDSRKFVSLKIYDLLGNEVVILVDEEKSAGINEVAFNGGRLASGVYIYRLSTEKKIISKKMVLLK
jgi:hypothetical protein